MDEETRARSRELARREVAAAPELTDEQREKLRAAVRGRVTPPATGRPSIRGGSEDA